MGKRLPFTETKTPWVHVLTTPWDEILPIWHQLANTSGVLARFIRGRRCQKTATFFDEIAAALQFPVSFGENWDALNDCLCDLSWWGQCEGVVLFVHEAQLLLKTAPAAEWPKLATVLDNVMRLWNEDAMPRSFHLVLHADAKSGDQLFKRCKAAGLAVK